MPNCIFCGDLTGKKFNAKKLYICEKCEKDKLNELTIFKIKNKSIKLLKYEIISDNEICVQYHSYKTDINKMFYEMQSNPDRVDGSIRIDNATILLNGVYVRDYEIENGITKIGIIINKILKQNEKESNNL